MLVGMPLSSPDLVLVVLLFSPLPIGSVPTRSFLCPWRSRNNLASELAARFRDFAFEGDARAERASGRA